MTNQPNDKQHAIKALCLDRYHSPGDFNLFTDKLLSFGVIRQTYDAFTDELFFYSQDALVCHFATSELDPAINKNNFTFGDALDVDRVKQAIDRLDTQKISVLAFHQNVAQAGVAYVSVHLKSKKIYYLGQDGHYFLECY